MYEFLHLTDDVDTIFVSPPSQSGRWRIMFSGCTFGILILLSICSGHYQACVHSVLKVNVPILMQIGTSGL